MHFSQKNVFDLSVLHSDNQCKKVNEEIYQKGYIISWLLKKDYINQNKRNLKRHIKAIRQPSISLLGWFITQLCSSKHDSPGGLQETSSPLINPAGWCPPIYSENNMPILVKQYFSARLIYSIVLIPFTFLHLPASASCESYMSQNWTLWIKSL